MNKVYSLDAENFDLTSLDELFDDLESDGLLNVGQVYYSADSETFNPSKYINVDNILENLDELIYDDLGGRYNYDLSCASVETKKRTGSTHERLDGEAHQDELLGYQRQVCGVYC